MRLVTFGILAAMVGTGCAIQAGDPGSDPVSSTEHTSTQTTTPKVHNATAAVAASATPPAPNNPEPSPWLPTGPDDVSMTGDSNGMNPEPSPWRPPAEGPDTTGDPENGSGAGTAAGSTTGSTPNRPDHLGSR